MSYNMDMHEVKVRIPDEAYVTVEFTPEVIAAIDKGAQEAREGKSMTRDQVTAYLAERRTEWLENHRA